MTNELAKMNYDFRLTQFASTKIPVPSSNFFLPETEIKEVFNRLYSKDAINKNCHLSFSGYIRPPEEWARAYLWKTFPTPNCYELFETLFSRWSVRPSGRVRRPPILVLGEAGTGKTSTIMSTAKLIYGTKENSYNIDDPAGDPEPIFFSAGGRNLDELLVENYFTDQSEPIVREIMSRYNGESTIELSENSIKLIERKFPQAISQHGKRNKLDINKLELNQETLDILNQIASWEGISKSSSTLGVTPRPGALIRACQTGRILIVDEIDKATGGTKLNEVLQAISDRREGSLHFEEKGVKFTFSSKTIHPLFDMVMTGNTASDYPGAFKGLRESFIQRFSKIYVHNVSIYDIALRAMQKLLGFNPHPLFFVKANNKKKSIIADYIMQLGGLPISNQATKLIENLDQTWEACLRLAAWTKACGIASHRENPDPKFSIISDTVYDNARGTYVEEYGVRWLQNIIEKSLDYKYRAVRSEGDVEAIEDVLNLRNLYEENPNFNEYENIKLGEAVEIIARKTIEGTPSSGEAREKFRILASLSGVIEEQAEKDSSEKFLPKHGEISFVKNLLVIDDNEEVIELPQEVSELRDALCEEIKRLHPVIRSSSNEKIIPSLALIQEIESFYKINGPLLLGIDPLFLQGQSNSPIKPLKLKKETISISEISSYSEQAISLHITSKLLKNPKTQKQTLSGIFGENFFENEEKTDYLKITKILVRNQEGQAEFALVFYMPAENKVVLYSPSLNKERTQDAILTSDLEEVEEAIRPSLTQKVKPKLELTNILSEKSKKEILDAFLEKKKSSFSSIETDSLSSYIIPEHSELDDSVLSYAILDYLQGSTLKSFFERFDDQDKILTLVRSDESEKKPIENVEQKKRKKKEEVLQMEMI